MAGQQQWKGHAEEQEIQFEAGLHFCLSLLCLPLPFLLLGCSVESLYYGFNRPWHQHQQRYVMTMRLCELHELECHCSGFRTTKWTLFFVGNLGRNAATKCIYELKVISKLSVTHYFDRGVDAKELQSVEKMY
uniref:Uncharacterized protein n=1 Tax=Oryza glumipatula TaxID=40148 RepID=A0A0D9Z1L5_9ORYZ